MLNGFARTRWPRLRFSESYAVRISVKISRICEFRVIMGIMTGLLGCCLSSTPGSRANDYVKTLATLGFWLHHSPCSLGCWTNNTLAARSLSPKQQKIFCYKILFHYKKKTMDCFLVIKNWVPVYSPVYDLPLQRRTWLTRKTPNKVQHETRPQPIEP